MKSDVTFSSAVSSLRTSEIRDLMGLAIRPDVISFAGGMPGNELFPVQEIDEVYRNLTTEEKQTAFQYGPTSGYPPLLDSLGQYLRNKGLPVESNRLMITTGSLQALNILGKIFLDPGDQVVTENPCFIGAIAAFKSYGAVLQGVAMDDDGVRIELLEEALDRSRSRPKFVYLTPNFHNPAGILTSERRRTEVAGILGTHAQLLIEDDAYGDLYFDERTARSVAPMKALFDDRLTICYTGSFSKILGPGFRLGWMLVPDEIYRRSELCKQSMDACSPNFTQVLAHRFLQSGKVYPYVARLREIYKGRRDLMLAAMREYFPPGVTWREPRGGFYVWVSLPADLEPPALLRSCVDQGAIFVVGATFDPEGKENGHIRLAFSSTPEEKIEQGIRIVGEAMKKCLRHVHSER